MSNMEERKRETKKKIVITCIIISVLGVLAVALIFLRAPKSYNAKKHVEVVLNLAFHGDAKEAAEFFDEPEEELYAGYLARVHNVMEVRIDKGTNPSEEVQAQYNELGKDMFGLMLYEVTETAKISKDEYQVTVTYQPTDALQKFAELNTAALNVCKEKMERGEYKGTQEEIEVLMRSEFENCRYQQLEEILQNITYLDEATFVFTVKKADASHFSISAQEVDQFVEKIVGL